MHISASGAFTSMYRMDVLANNLANVNTAGYKPEIAIPKLRHAARIEDDLMLPSNLMLERLGGGVHMGANRIAFEQGSLLPTDAPLDLAIRGEGFFVVRESSDGSSDRVRLTRNGRFATDAQGRLVAADTGMPVMSAGGDEITLSGKLRTEVTKDGTILQNGSPVDRLKIVDVPDTSKLSKIGHSMFSAPVEAIASSREGGGIVEQGAIEQSSVDPLRATLAISAAARDIETNVSLMQYSDRMLDRAINALGRV